MPLLLRKTMGAMTVPVHHARGALYREMRTDGLALAPQQKHWECLKTPPRGFLSREEVNSTARPLFSGTQ